MIQNTISTNESASQDSELSNQAPSTALSSATSTTNSATNGSNTGTAETPRSRHKRRKGESSESQILDCDAILGAQNYKIPDQNSIELYKNIRKQVDKRLRNLNIIHPRIPYGFNDYMLSRGAYLLDGNKLGNGTNLFTNEDGGLNTAPAGKYHAIRHNRVSYTVPNRARVPPVISVNSPLYGLFIEQEKERHRMRMQHIKEREKLTLAAEQEIMRVYNHAALNASDQTEPFSVCTMLKHQEIYDYLNSDGKVILSLENAQQDQETVPDGVRTRRRQHGNISPNTPNGGQTSSQSRKNSNTDEATAAAAAIAAKVDDKTPAASEATAAGCDTQTSTTAAATTTADCADTKEVEKSSESSSKNQSIEAKRTTSETSPAERQDEGKPEEGSDKAAASADTSTTPSDEKKLEEGGDSNRLKEDNTKKDDAERDAGTKSIETNQQGSKDGEKSLERTAQTSEEKAAPMEVDESEVNESVVKSESVCEAKCKQPATTTCSISGEESLSKEKDSKIDSPSESKAKESDAQEQQPPPPSSSSDDIDAQDKQTISDEEQRAQIREMFLVQLQEVDDKWDSIRKDMLARHRNEAESLYAIQRLEWEWKTKEIGACDVRATPVIDSTLVPRLSIYSQDY